ncbi:MAG TPA: pyridoxamine 5'-phosphate oxidase family protein [Kineosporiaceae bacterium]|nr:pyridoxamine 5'-phosphate oxidase family protein [Kineosporiaceae bacterium]
MSEQTEYPQGPRTTPTRLRERAVYAVDAVHAVLDEALICHVGVVVDGEPVVLPTIHARVDRALYLHSSTGSRLARLAADGGVPVCVTVTLLDGLVLARSQFHHSMNYRSVVVRGRAQLVTDPGERTAALAAVVEHIVPGRAEGSRPPDAKELAATSVLRVVLEEATLKQRTGPPSDDDEDLALAYWAGVVPVSVAFGAPHPAPDLAPTVAVPDHVAGLQAH